MTPRRITPTAPVCGARREVGTTGTIVASLAVESVGTSGVDEFDVDEPAEGVPTSPKELGD